MTFILNLKLTNHSVELKKSSRGHGVALSVLTGRCGTVAAASNNHSARSSARSLGKAGSAARIRRARNGIPLPQQTEKNCCVECRRQRLLDLSIRSRIAHAASERHSDDPHFPFVTRTALELFLPQSCRNLAIDAMHVQRESKDTRFWDEVSN
jgi:hypothetical protein